MTSSLHFLYHELRPAKSRYSYVTPCDEFEAHCALFTRLQRAPIEGWLRPEITFDDGNLSDVLHALPVLGRNSLVATFFITAGWTGTRAGFMDWPQLRELQSAGHRIGAHGLTHKLLTACSPVELDQELRGAKQRLEDGLGTPIEVMSLPGGRADRRVLSACEQAGFTQIFTSVPQAEDMDRAPKTIGRLNLLAGTTVPWLEDMLDPTSGALARLQRNDRIKTLAKRALGDRLYAKVWATVNRQEAEPQDGEAPA